MRFLFFVILSSLSYSFGQQQPVEVINGLGGVLTVNDSINLADNFFLDVKQASVPIQIKYSKPGHLPAYRSVLPLREDAVEYPEAVELDQELIKAYDLLKWENFAFTLGEVSTNLIDTYDDPENDRQDVPKYYSGYYRRHLKRQEDFWPMEQDINVFDNSSDPFKIVKRQFDSFFPRTQSLFKIVDNELIVDVEIMDAKVQIISNCHDFNLGMPGKTNPYFVKTALKLHYVVKNVFGDKLLETYDWSISGEFSGYLEKTYPGYYFDALRPSVIDCFKKSVHLLLNDENFEKIQFNQNALEEEYEELTLFTSEPHVKSIEEAVNATYIVITENGHGSGFLIDDKGYLVTNYHVINKSEKIQVQNVAGERFSAELIRGTKLHDLALLKINVDSLTGFEIKDSIFVHRAEKIYAIGTPVSIELGHSLSKGQFLGSKINSKGIDLYETIINVSPGNSGGPLINENGELLGVVTSKAYTPEGEFVTLVIPSGEILKRLSLSQQKQ